MIDRRQEGPTRGSVAPLYINSGMHALGRLLYGQSRPARLLRWALAALGVALGLASALRSVPASMDPRGIHLKDFVQEYVLAKAIAVGDSPYEPVNVLTQRYLGVESWFPYPSLHPPPVGLLFLPLSYLSYPTAVNIWLGLQVLCLVTSVYLLARGSGIRLGVWATPAIAAAMLAWYPFWDDLSWGQLNLLLLLILAAARLALLRDRPAAAGFLVGFAVLVKLFAWPLLLLFLLRRLWRALGAAVCTILVGYLASGWVIGFRWIPEYFMRIVPDHTRNVQGSIFNQSVWSIGLRLFSGTGAAAHNHDKVVAPPLLPSDLAASVVSIALPIVVVLVACLAARRQGGLDAAFGVMICTSILVSPLVWSHYLVLMAIPVAYVIAWLAAHRLPARETSEALLVGMLLFPSVADWSAPMLWISGQAPTQSGSYVLPFAPTLLMLVPTLAVAALGWLVSAVGSRKVGVKSPL